MRTILTTILAAAMAMPMAAQETKVTNDTIVVNAPGKVLVTKAASGAVNVAVKGREGNEHYRLRYNTEIQEKDTTEWNLDLPFLKKQKSGWMTFFGGLYIGSAINNGEPQGTELKRGLDFGVTHLIGAKYLFGNSGTSFSTGLGFGYQMIWGENSSIRFNRVNGALTLEGLPEGASDVQLHTRNWFLNLPIQLTQRFGKSFGISAGVLLHSNFNTYAENKYTLDGKEYTEKMRSLKTRRMSYELFGSIGWRDISLYVKYNPNGMFRDGCGPQYSTLSVGFKLLNF